MQLGGLRAGRKPRVRRSPARGKGSRGRWPVAPGRSGSQDSASPTRAGQALSLSMAGVSFVAATGAGTGARPAWSSVGLIRRCALLPMLFVSLSQEDVSHHPGVVFGRGS